MTRVCSDCHSDKEIGEFKKGSDQYGRGSICKCCDARRARSWRSAATPEQKRRPNRCRIRPADTRVTCPECGWPGERVRGSLYRQCPKCGADVVAFLSKPHKNLAIIAGRPQPSAVLCAWAAGIVEGEGYIGIRKGHQQLPSLAVCIVNTDKEMLEPFPVYWGGQLRRAPTPKNPRCRQAWAWRVSSREAEVFLKAIAVHLVTTRVKRKTALAFEFRAQKQDGRRLRGEAEKRYVARQYEYYRRMAHLNVRGVAISKAG